MSALSHPSQHALKKKIYNLIRSLENPLPGLNHNKAETRWGFLVACPTTWDLCFPAAHREVWGKYAQILLFDFFPFPPLSSMWFEIPGFWEHAIFHMKMFSDGWLFTSCNRSSFPGRFHFFSFLFDLLFFFFFPAQINTRWDLCALDTDIHVCCVAFFISVLQ